MSLISVDEIFSDPNFMDTFDVIRRPEVVDSSGRSTVAGLSYMAGQRGAVYPTGMNNIIRQEDAQHGRNTITVVTPFSLYQTIAGFQPDLVVWEAVANFSLSGSYTYTMGDGTEVTVPEGAVYLVRSVNSYAKYGAGWIEAVCSTLEFSNRG